MRRDAPLFPPHARVPSALQPLLQPGKFEALVREQLPWYRLDDQGWRALREVEALAAVRSVEETRAELVRAARAISLCHRSAVQARQFYGRLRAPDAPTPHRPALVHGSADRSDAADQEAAVVFGGAAMPSKRVAGSAHRAFWQVMDAHHRSG